MRAQVRVFELKPRGKSWRVRWKVGSAPATQRTFTRKAEADRFRASLLKAIDDGVHFDSTTMLPVGAGMAESVSVAEWSRTWWLNRWSERAAKSRGSDAEMLTDVVASMLRRDPEPGTDVRGWVRTVLCRRQGADEPSDLPADLLRGGVHIERWSPHLNDLTTADGRELWDRLGKTLEGRKAAATTSTRRRTLATKLFDDAVRCGLMHSNPLRAIDRPRRTSSRSVDPTLLPKPAEARDLIETISTRSEASGRSEAFLLTMLLSGARPSEVSALTETDIRRSAEEWDELVFRRGRTISSTQFTDNGESWDTRDQLKWRPEGHTRRVNVPPELTMAIDAHIAKYGLGPDGLIFCSASGKPIQGSVGPLVRAAVRERWPEPHPFAQLCLYDLRHIHATALLNNGIAPTQVAKRLGHSVSELLKTYAGVFDTDDESERQRIETSLR